MLHGYKVIAARRKAEKHTVTCPTATATVAERDRPIAQGWGVCISDEDGIPQSDRMMLASAAEEAAAKRVP